MAAGRSQTVLSGGRERLEGVMSGQVIEAARQIACPSCGAVEDFKKASVLYEAGTSSLDGRTHSGGVGLGFSGGGIGIGVGSSAGTIRGTQQTNLAQKLAPPYYPQNWGIGKWFLILVFTVLIGNATNAPTIGFLFLGGLIYWRHTSKKKARALHQSLYQKWDTLWHCCRCGNSSYV